MKLLAIVALISVTTLARAEPADSTSGVTGGLLAAIAPTLVGGILLAEGDGKTYTQASAIFLIQSGLVLAPFITHAASGEYARGFAFSAVPTASLIGMIALIHARPTLFADANRNSSRYVFATLLGVSVLSSVIGIADGFGARDRARRRQHKTLVMPTVLPNGGGLGLSHTF